MSRIKRYSSTFSPEGRKLFYWVFLAWQMQWMLQTDLWNENAVNPLNIEHVGCRTRMPHFSNPTSTRGLKACYWQKIPYSSIFRTFAGIFRPLFSNFSFSFNYLIETEHIPNSFGNHIIHIAQINSHCFVC